jgi:predicted  nucleic acid-binding Zn-ribbon protein
MSEELSRELLIKLAQYQRDEIAKLKADVAGANDEAAMHRANQDDLAIALDKAKRSEEELNQEVSELRVDFERIDGERKEGIERVKQLRSLVGDLVRDFQTIELLRTLTLSQ